MENYTLQNVDPDDVSFWLAEIEATFEANFPDDAFSDVSTFGQLCDRVKSLLTLPHDERCTYQMAFHGLKKAWNTETSKIQISPRTSLAELLPEESRPRRFRQLEERFGLELEKHFATKGIVRQPPLLVVIGLIAIGSASLIGLFFN